MRLENQVLYVAAALYLGVGALFLVWPSATSLVGLALASATADNDVRAVYGGANVGLGVFFLLAASRPAWTRPALWGMALALGGMAAARLLSWAVVGFPEPIGYALHASEVLGVLLAVAGLRSARRD